MARICATIIGLSFVAAVVGVSADGAPEGRLTAGLKTVAVGRTAFAYTTVSGVDPFGQTSSFNVPPHWQPSCGYWGNWRLLRVEADKSRRYGEFVYDGCNAEKQVFPVPTDPLYGSCNNDDNLVPSAKYSLCPVLPTGTVPAGMPFDPACMALAETAVSLHADLAHDPTDTTNTYTVTTSLSQDFASRLNDATCSDVLDWRITGWEISWPDGQVDAKPGTGQSGTADVRQLPPGQSPDPATTRVLVKAHLHITAHAVDFDDNATPYVRSLSADVVLTNDPAASQAGIGGAPVYTPPQLAAAAICINQTGDGSLPPFDPTLTHRTACDTLRGRLLEVFPQVTVTRPGQELVGGVSVGTARSVVTGWTFTGGYTDAPPGEATPPDAAGRPNTPVAVQYNHAARIDERSGSPVPEPVPFRLSVQTTYPDGHVETEQVSGSLAVTIYYVGLNYEG